MAIQLVYKESLTLQCPGIEIPLELPVPEINGIPAVPVFTERIDCTGNRLKYIFSLGEKAKLELTILHCQSFIRMRCCLKGSGAALTKKLKGKDNFCYTGFNIPSQTEFTEIQLNHYSNTRHTYFPVFVKRPETRWLDEASFTGPVILAQFPSRNKNCTLLCGYEHGGEWTDNYLGFHIDRKGDACRVHLECEDGTYCNGTFFSDEKPYHTPWFHIGVCEGAEEDMLRLYRNFILNDLPVSKASREPLIFYNTWNNQERNKALRKKGCWDDMNTAQMLKDIHIAHQLGIDVFVLDTGWFKAAGDWEVSDERFPDDLREIKALLDKYNMRLGLWFDPNAASVSSRINREHPEYRRQVGGKDAKRGPIWGTEEGYGMCVVSGYAEWFAEKLVDIGKRYGVSYFKWDGINTKGCSSDRHNHGGPDVPEEERARNYGFQSGMALTWIAEEVCRRLPGAIVDLDVTESDRYAGLGFLQAGRFFAINNGPYYHDFDIPDAAAIYRDNWNVFFYSGTARNLVCRQIYAFDKIIPSIALLTHFLPDGPSVMRQNALNSLYLGGNGIWGDLPSLNENDIREIAEGIARYKKVAQDVTLAYPRLPEAIGTSPEIYEKINPLTGKGIVVFFTKAPVDVLHVTQRLEICGSVWGADDWSRLDDGRIKLKVSLGKDESRAVFLLE